MIIVNINRGVSSSSSSSSRVVVIVVVHSIYVNSKTNNFTFFWFLYNKVFIFLVE